MYNVLLKTLLCYRLPQRAPLPLCETHFDQAQTLTRLTTQAGLFSPAPSPLTGESSSHASWFPSLTSSRRRWETIDASDASFLSDDRLQVLRIAVSHPAISLYTLNAPQNSINDVTPLSMAAWLDMPQVVDILLSCSSGAVSVDAEDTDGATPLMCKSLPTVSINIGIHLATGYQMRHAMADWKSCNIW